MEHQSRWRWVWMMCVGLCLTHSASAESASSVFAGTMADYVPTAQLLQVQRRLADKKINSVIVPAYYWGVNHVTGSFPGSIDIRPEVMTELMIDVFRSLASARAANGSTRIEGQAAALAHAIAAAVAR